MVDTQNQQIYAEIIQDRKTYTLKGVTYSLHLDPSILNKKHTTLHDLPVTMYYKICDFVHPKSVINSAIL
jgi:hypothetical protein